MYSATAHNGVVFKRGDAIFIQHRGICATGFIENIKEAGEGPTISALIIVGEVNNVKGVDGPPIDYLGAGVAARHLSDPAIAVGDISRGVRFVLVSEGPEALKSLNDHLNNVFEDTQDLHEEASKQPGSESGEVTEANRPAGESEPQQFDPADKDRDGTVSEKERRKFDKKHPQ